MLKINRLLIDTTSTKSDLCTAGALLGTDKSPYNTTATHRHPYTAIYDLLFSGLRHTALALGEVGILDNASMKMWRSYFSCAKLYGFEFDQNRINNALNDGLPNTRYFLSDVSNIDSLRASFCKADVQFDILIDDSTHLFDHQMNFVEAALHFVKPGGLLIIEDVFNGWDENIYAEKLQSFENYIEAATFLVPDHALKYSEGMPEPYYNNDKILMLRRNDVSLPQKKEVLSAETIEIIEPTSSQISIFVVTHKSIPMPGDNNYFVIQAGNASKPIPNVLHDDVGDNISIKNPYYSELTAHYWIWKNVRSEYVALMHYRRFLSPKTAAFQYLGADLARASDLLAELQTVDIITSEPFLFFHSGSNLPETVEQHYVRNHGYEFLEARRALENKYPSCVQTFDAVMRNNKLFANNLMAMKKTVFDSYCEWAFPLFYEIEKNLDLKKYDAYQMRVIAFLSERLFTVWILQNKKRLSVAHRNMILLANA